MSETPDLLDKFDYRGDEILVKWFDLIGKKIPDLPKGKRWQTVKIFAKFHGKIVLVFDSHFSLPGGHYEDFDEKIENTIFREFREETAGEILDWTPIGYQIATNSRTGETNYQLRVFANVENVAKNIDDPGGEITKTKLVALENLLDEIGWHDKLGDRMVKIIREKYWNKKGDLRK